MKRSITLDAGHGGKDSGAVGVNGLREKDIALAVTLRLGAMLAAAGLAVNYTRKDDRFLELYERADLANEAATDYFLSIHCNSSSNRGASGFEVFTAPGQTDADELATFLFVEYARAFPEKLKRIDDKDGDPDKEANFLVLRRTKMPAALFELDFISSPSVEKWLGEELNQIAMAEALCDGVLRFVGIGAVKVPAGPPEAPVKQSFKQRLRNVSTLLANLAEEAP
jgi:N-acetylmuramoyl-L-alanine amidase